MPRFVHDDVEKASLAFFKGDTIGYQDLAAETKAVTGESVSAQAIADKVRKSDDLFKSLAATAIARSQQLPKASAISIPNVKDILVADASTIALKKSLAPLMPGTGGSGPIASAKIHAFFNVSAQRFVHLALTEGTASDHRLADDHFAASSPGDLIIRDLGYFEIADLRRLNEGGRYFVSRLPLSLTYFWQDGRLIDPWKWLATSKLKVVDQVLTIGGDERLEARVPSQGAWSRADAAGNGTNQMEPDRYQSFGLSSLGRHAYIWVRQGLEDRS